MIKNDKTDKLLLLKIKVQSSYYVLCNVYTPTQEHKLDQNNFAIKLRNIFAPFDNEYVLIGGNFNYYSNPKQDNIDIMKNRYDNNVYRREIHSIMESMELYECFREL